MDFSWQQLKRRVLPVEEVAGFSVSDGSMRLLLIARENLRVIFRAEENLPQGVVVNGELKKPAEFLASLQKLKHKSGSEFLRHPVAILSLASTLFYLRIIELPEMGEASYDEAARLNATQLSPIKLDEGYFDWQNLGVNLRTFQREVLISVGASSKIDPYLEMLRRAGIDVIAIEPASLGFIRVVNYFALTAEKNAPHLIFAVGPEGLQFLISKEGKIFLDRSLAWQELEEAKDGEISRQDFEKILLREVAKLLNFYVTHHQEEVLNAVVITPILYQELAQILRQSFKLKVVPLELPPVFGGSRQADLWASAIGAALRGIIPRGEDTIISLMPLGTEALYGRHRLYGFVSLWTKIVSGTVVGTLIMLGVLAAIILKVERFAEGTLLALERSANVQESKKFESEATTFNRLVYDILSSQKQGSLWSERLGYLGEAVGRARPNIVGIRQMNFSEGQATVNIKAFASSRQVALAFKQDLEKSGAFESVELPINSVSDVPGGVTFNLVIKLK